MNHYDEMVSWILPQVILVNRSVTVPYLQERMKKKLGLEVVDLGKNFGEIRTKLDVGVSSALLNGGVSGVEGFRSRYKGSFSEEDDAFRVDRVNSLEILEVDPIDGTGDLEKTLLSPNLMPATTLVTKLGREGDEEMFFPLASLVFETINEYALVSDGTRLGLFKVMANGDIKEISFELGYKQNEEWTGHSSTGRSALYLNRRLAYPQANFDVEFKKWNDGRRRITVQVPVGGAGMQALQFFRSFIHPIEKDIEAFYKLQAIDVIFNCQPDWKTWDTDPIKLIAKAVAVKRNWPRLEVDILGASLAVNAIHPLPQKHMIHRTGCVVATNESIQRVMLFYARQFMAETGLDLLETNY